MDSLKAEKRLVTELRDKDRIRERETPKIQSKVNLTDAKGEK